MPKEWKPRKPKKATAEAVGAGRGVLVVDDEGEVSCFLCEAAAFHPRVGEIHAASCCTEALDLFNGRAGEISIVLLDHRMSGRSGLECLRDLDSLAIRPVAVIMISAAPRTVIESRFMSFKGRWVLPIAYIAKPLKIAWLVEAIDRAIHTLDQREDAEAVKTRQQQ